MTPLSQLAAPRSLAVRPVSSPRRTAAAVPESVAAGRLLRRGEEARWGRAWGPASAAAARRAERVADAAAVPAEARRLLGTHGRVRS
jgi:hypothetical protein